LRSIGEDADAVGVHDVALVGAPLLRAHRGDLARTALALPAMAACALWRPIAASRARQTVRGSPLGGLVIHRVELASVQHDAGLCSDDPYQAVDRFRALLGSLLRDLRVLGINGRRQAAWSRGSGQQSGA
jgi:hypothetical protein